MNHTSLSLLDSLRNSPESESWNRLVELYAPLLQVWLRKYDVQPSDEDDLVQEVLLAVSKALGKFEHSGQTGAFRAWLKAILVNQLRRFWRTRRRHPQAAGTPDMETRLGQLEDPASAMSQLWQQEHDQHVLQQLLVRAEPHFTSETWTAFRRVVFDGAKAEDVAEEIGISRNAVVLAKSRVLRRLRRESAGLVDSSAGIPN